MKLFSDAITGELAIEPLPDDIVERLERRVEEKRFLGSAIVADYRLVRDPAPPEDASYRESAPRTRTFQVELVRPAGTYLEHVELDFGDRVVRYRVRFPRVRRGTIVVSAIFGGLFFAAGVALAIAAGLGLGAMFAAFGLALFALLIQVARMDARARAGPALLGILREEISNARAEERLRAEIRAEVRGNVRVAAPEPEREPEPEPEAEAEADDAGDASASRRNRA